MAIKIIKADDLAPYSVDDILKARDLAVEALKQMGTTKNNSKFCPDRKAKTTHMETLLHCVEDECVAYKDGKCLKYNSDQEPTTKNNLGVEEVTASRALDILDKIRAELVRLTRNRIMSVDCKVGLKAAINILDEYKAETEE